LFSRSLVCKRAEQREHIVFHLICALKTRCSACASDLNICFFLRQTSPSTNYVIGRCVWIRISVMCMCMCVCIYTYISNSRLRLWSRLKQRNEIDIHLVRSTVQVIGIGKQTKKFRVEYRTWFKTESVHES